MKFSLATLAALLLATTIAFAQDYQAPTQENESQPAVQDNQAMPADQQQPFAAEEAPAQPVLQEAGTEQFANPEFSLLPDEEQDSVSGTLSSWSTSPTGIYRESELALGSPFPMAASPALQRHAEDGILPRESELPPSMSGNISSWETAPTARYDAYRTEAGSPFPMAADPANRTGNGRKFDDVDEGANFSRGQAFPDTASPFPTGAAPARRNGW